MTDDELFKTYQIDVRYEAVPLVDNPTDRSQVQMEERWGWKKTPVMQWSSLPTAPATAIDWLIDNGYGTQSGEPPNAAFFHSKAEAAEALRTALNATKGD